MFSDPRGPDVPGLIKPMEFYPFLGVLGALGPIFRKKIIFRVKIMKDGKWDFLLDFQFLCENQYFCEIQQIAKTPIILMDY